MVQTVGTRGAVRHPHADDVLLAERLGGQKCGQRRVHAARQSHDPFFEAAPAKDLILQETHQPFTSQFGVNGEGIGMGGPRPDHTTPFRRKMGQGRCTICRGVELHRRVLLPSPFSRF